MTRSGHSRRVAPVLLALLATCALALPALGAEPSTPAVPSGDIKFSFNVNTGSGDGTKMSDLMKIVMVLSLLTLAPSILLTMTSFTRIIIVLSFVRRALSVQNLPPNQTIIGLSIFLTIFIMAPVFAKVNEVAIQPSVRGEISDMEAMKRGLEPLREFMLKQTRKKDLALFLNVAKLPRPATAADVPTHVLIPAFALSEIKTSFQMGFLIFLPMLVVDIVVATLLTSMGMFMLPPAMVSVPLKILLFVLVDGWHLVIGSLARSFN
jgi:flagellar biosynthetic protein FliP